MYEIVFLPYITPIQVFASHVALLGFHSFSLLSPLEQVTLWLRIIPVQPERVSEGRRNRKPRKNHITMTRILTHNLCIQSRACYPLGYSDLPNKYIILRGQKSPSQKSCAEYIHFKLESHTQQKFVLVS